MKKSKWLVLGAMVCSGGALLQGCLNAFWQGLFNTGWPTDNPAINLGIDIANEIIFG